MSECTKCHGTGKVTCSKCDGEKKVKCDECAGSGTKTSICPTCHRGKIEKDRWINCNECHGTGQVSKWYTRCNDCGYKAPANNHPAGSRCNFWIADEDRRCRGIYQAQIESCSRCDGRGQIKETYYEICPNCHGEWQKPAGPCEKCNGTGKITCASCKGTGKEDCSLCNGTGSVDVEAMCKRLICIMPAADGFYLKENMQLFEDDITADMVSAIHDAAAKGLGVAMFVMGELFQHGLEIDGKVVVERDWDKATEYMHKGAEAGDSLAQGAYGLRLIEKDKETAVRWLVTAGENGNIESLYFLAIHGCIYGEYGHGKDLVKALEYFNKILNVHDDISDAYYINGAKGYVKFLPRIIDNDTEAMLELAAWLYENSENFTSTDYEVTDIVHSPGVNVDKVEEHAYSYWILQAAKAGNIEAMMKVAKLYWEKGEKSKANEWYEKAASQGDAKTLLELGKRLRKGDGIAKDHSKAFIYFYRAAEQGNISAVKLLGLMYYYGEYVEKNREHAVQLYIRAAKSGDSGALYSVGMYYLNQKKDEVEAKRLMRLSAEKGDESAKKALTSIPDSVKDKNKGPSGIVVGKPDNGPLPKFVKADYDCAVAGKAAVKSPAPQSKSTSSSPKKRWKFVVLGLLFGFFGVHLAYAKRWFLFLLLWAAFITGGVMSGGKGEPDKPAADAETTQVAEPADSPKKDDDSPIGKIGFAVWGLLWIGGTLFIKKDGKGNRM